MWSVGPFVFCATCGSHSRDNAQHLLLPCRGGVHPQTRPKLDRLWEGAHPRTGLPLQPHAMGQLKPRPFGEFVLDATYGGLVVVDKHVEVDG